MYDKKGLSFLHKILNTLFSIKDKLTEELIRELRKHDIKRSEFIALLNIHVEGEKSMSCLCKKIDIKMGSLTTVIDNLIEKEYVCRKFDIKDRRKIIVCLTLKGKKFMQNLDLLVEATALKKIKNLTAKDRNIFFNTLDILEKISEKL